MMLGSAELPIKCNINLATGNRPALFTHDPPIVPRQVSVHPFTGGTHPTDVRMTTRFKEDDLLEGLTGGLWGEEKVIGTGGLWTGGLLDRVKERF